MSAGKAVSTQAAAEAAAALLLDEGATSLDAVVGGFLAAAALDAGTLFAPAALLVAGVGRGVRCIDGRTVQPGIGTRRPRGVAPGQPTPDAAFAAVPRTLGLLALAHTHGGTKALSSLVRPAGSAARKAGAEGRAKLLAAVGSRGPRALQQTEVARALLAAAGPSAGGTLVEDDLRDPLPADERAVSLTLADGTTAALPAFQATAAETRPGDGARRGDLRSAEVLVAADVHGSVASLAWSPDPEGVLVPELEVRLPRDAAPVMRGVPRVTPGTVRPAALPLAVLTRPADSWYAALGIGGRPDLASDELALEVGGLGSLLERLADVQRGSLALTATVARGKVQTLRVGGRR